MTKLSILTAMPALKKSLFSYSTILMGEITSTGALGIIINIPTNVTLKETLKILNFQIDDKFNDDLLNHPILFGGPVNTDFFWILHANTFESTSTINLNDQLSLTSALEIFPLINKEYCPKIYHVGLGYSGWGPKQLNAEIQDGSWWLSNIDEEVIFSSDLESRWDTVIRSLGVNPSCLVDFTNIEFPSIN